MRRTSPPQSRPPTAVYGSILVVVILVVSATGCGGDHGSRPLRSAVGGGVAAPSAHAMPEAVRQQLLDGAMAVLGRLEGYDEESAFAQVFDRLNQWSHGLVLAGGAEESKWSLDPLYESLPPALRAVASPQSLESGVFDARQDVPMLRDQRWLADIAASARGDAIDDLAVARNLFTWTVRSLALVSDPPPVPTDANPGTRWFSLGEILLAGRASGPQRAWVFLELLRHAGLDGVMLATGDASAGSPRPWIPALVSDGEAYLFETVYGMPVPGPGGVGVATARQAASDPGILGALSLPDRVYPVQAADVAALSVLVPATPGSVSRRMHLLDGHLAGSVKIDLTVAASDLGVSATSALPGAGDAGRTRLWEFPWETERRRRDAASTVSASVAKELTPLFVALEESVPGGRDARRVVRPLYAARVREFRGDLEGPDGAKMAYLLARPSSKAIAEAVKRAPPEQAEGMHRLYDAMKEDATYWLGVLTLAEGEYETAVDYLGRMVLELMPDSPWADAARVNLATAQVALGRTADAVLLLRADTSPQRFGSRLTADRLARPPVAGDP